MFQQHVARLHAIYLCIPKLQLSAPVLHAGAPSMFPALSLDYRDRPRQVTSRHGMVAADHGRCSDMGELRLQCRIAAARSGLVANAITSILLVWTLTRPSTSNTDHVDIQSSLHYLQAQALQSVSLRATQVLVITVQQSRSCCADDN